MAVNSLETYSDEELGRMLRVAIGSGAFEGSGVTYRGSAVPHRTALAAALRLAGLGELSDAIVLLKYVWERVKRLFQLLFGTATARLAPS
jgi:hypothetical protein